MSELNQDGIVMKIEIDDFKRLLKERNKKLDILEKEFAEKFKKKFGDHAVTADEVYADEELKELCFKIFETKGFDRDYVERMGKVPLFILIERGKIIRITMEVFGDKTFYMYEEKRKILPI